MTNPKKDIAISNQITLLVEAINCDNTRDRKTIGKTGIECGV